MHHNSLSKLESENEIFIRVAIKDGSGPEYDCTERGFTLDEMRKLAGAFRNIHDATVIFLSLNDLDNKSMLYVREIILNCPSELKKITLRTNNIEAEGIELLLNGDPSAQGEAGKAQEISNKRIREILPGLEIVFSDNPIRDKGLNLIREFLSPESILHLIDHVYNTPAVYEEARTAAVKTLQERRIQTSQSEASFQNAGYVKDHEEEKTQVSPKSPKIGTVE